MREDTGGMWDECGDSFNLVSTMASCKADFKCHTESYSAQKDIWPQSGRHILANYDEDSVVVYQAFRPSIADFAVKNQRFGGPDYSFQRMSWIKTNFLWMMYRCGWATKPGQEKVLAVRINRGGFEEILSHALIPSVQKSLKISNEEVSVRLQWDPDHEPNYAKCERRAIQLGLKGEILQKYATEWVISIEDITDFVHEQYNILGTEGEDMLIVAKKRVYIPSNPQTAERIQLSQA